MTAEAKLDSLCLRGLLRWLGAGSQSGYEGSVSNLAEEDLEALRMWWALSRPVGKLAERCASRPRDISPTLEDFHREVSGDLTGPPDAAGSTLLQARTGDPSAFVVTEPDNTWLSGPNRVMAKTLHAAHAALRAAAPHTGRGLFDDLVRERLTQIDNALRTAPMTEILSSHAGRARIVANERRQAAKARAPLYRLAWDCAEALEGIEALEPERLRDLLSADLLPRMEAWRRFEMALVMEAGEALAEASKHPFILDASFAAKRPVARIGDLEIWWQRAIPSRPFYLLDEGERIAEALANSLGVPAGTARADVTIERKGRILALIECKWFGNPTSAAAGIREACPQIVGYARDAAWKQGESANEILERSLVALASRGSSPIRVGTGPIGCIDLSDLGRGSLAPWAAVVLAA